MSKKKIQQRTESTAALRGRRRASPSPPRSPRKHPGRSRPVKCLPVWASTSSSSLQGKGRGRGTCCRCRLLFSSERRRLAPRPACLPKRPATATPRGSPGRRRTRGGGPRPRPWRRCRRRSSPTPWPCPSSVLWFLSSVCCFVLSFFFSFRWSRQPKKKKSMLEKEISPFLPLFQPLICFRSLFFSLNAAF